MIKYRDGSKADTLYGNEFKTLTYGITIGPIRWTAFEPGDDGTVLSSCKSKRSMTIKFIKIKTFLKNTGHRTISNDSLAANVQFPFTSRYISVSSYLTPSHILGNWLLSITTVIHMDKQNVFDFSLLFFRLTLSNFTFIRY